MMIMRGYNHLTFTIDNCRRTSTCEKCSKPIPKGHRRAVFEGRLPRPLPLPNSRGTIFIQRVFFHPDCMAELLLEDGSPKESKATCFECTKPIHTPVNFTYVKKHGPHYPLCGDCIQSERWRFCRYCNLYATRYEASEVIDECIPSGHFCCDRCQPEMDVLTVKVRKRLRREYERAEGRSLSAA